VSEERIKMDDNGHQNENELKTDKTKIPTLVLENFLMDLLARHISHKQWSIGVRLSFSDFEGC
jgi:hypothetical protein